jgi:hypothetical protein
MTAGIYRHDEQGRTLYSPRFPRNRHFVVPADKIDSWPRFVRWLSVAFLIVIAVSVPVLGPWWGALLSLVLFLAVYGPAERRFVRSLEPTQTVPIESRRDLVRRTARATGRKTLLAMAVYAGLMVVFGGIMLAFGELLLGVASIGVFGAVEWGLIRQLRSLQGPRPTAQSV